jgi:stress-induced morphogen
MAADLDEVRRLIERALPGADVEVVDETGTADHLLATVAAPQFTGLSRIDQHRLVKAAVQERMADGSIHALSVKTIVPGPEAGPGGPVTSRQEADQ